MQSTYTIKNKTICAILTNRTNYSKLKPILIALKEMNTVNLKIIASSSSILEKYGNTFNDLIKDGLEISYKIDCLLMNDSHEAMVNTSALSQIKHASIFSECEPSLILIVGDRYDALPAAIAAMMMNIPIAHIQGGEDTGTIDDKVRNLISLSSAIHFVSTERSKQKLINLGIHKENVFNFGCPAVEYINNINVGSKFDIRKLNKKFSRMFKEDEEYFLVLVHPDTTNKNDVSMDILLNAVNTFSTNILLFYPNTDANNSLLLNDIRKYNNQKNFYFIKHLPLEGFIHVLAHAKCLIGNSSSGIREAASFGTPVLNVGDRQIGRERNENVIDVSSNHNEIENGIKKCLSIKYKKNNIYFKKNGTKKIINKILERL